MATPGITSSTVMGPDGSIHSSSTFTEKLPPSFDGHSNYSVYRQDVELWLCLTSLDEEKQGPALIGRLSGELKLPPKLCLLQLLPVGMAQTRYLNILTSPMLSTQPISWTLIWRHSWTTPGRTICLLSNLSLVSLQIGPYCIPKHGR